MYTTVFILAWSLVIITLVGTASLHIRDYIEYVLALVIPSRYQYAYKIGMTIISAILFLLITAAAVFVSHFLLAPFSESVFQE